MGKRSKEGVHKKSLGDEIEDPESHGVRVYPRKKARNQVPKADEDEGNMDATQSSKILSLAREQQVEQAREAAKLATAGFGALDNAVRSLASKPQAESDDDESDISDSGDHLIADGEPEFSAEDEAAFNAFLNKDSPGEHGQLLSELISAKLRERIPLDSEARGNDANEMDEDMERIYGDVGKLLSRYTTGKLPKAFRVIPWLRNWEDVLFMTDPQKWSPHATFAATKMFVSQLNVKQVQRFLNLILLNKVRDDIRENKRLHFALFQAVKKAVFKPGAFYKGFVLPLLKQGNCTLREAVILSAVLNRVSVPMDHSAAALMRMADMPYSGVTSFMMKTLLDKKYALPYRTVDALVDHFVGFRHEQRSLPVIWHLCLLTFVQRYKNDIRAEDKEALRNLLKVQAHQKVTPEVRRELGIGYSRGQDAPRSAKKNMLTSNAEDIKHMAPIIVDDVLY